MVEGYTYLDVGRSLLVLCSQDITIAITSLDVIFWTVSKSATFKHFSCFVIIMSLNKSVHC